jgi:anti-anti-sigma factor
MTSRKVLDVPHPMSGGAMNSSDRRSADDDPVRHPCPRCAWLLWFRAKSSTPRHSPRRFARCPQCGGSFTLYGGHVSEEPRDIIGMRAPNESLSEEVALAIELSTLVVGDTAVVRVRGDLDHETGSHLAERVHPILAGGARNLVVDFADTTYLDSGGLQVLLELRDTVHRQAGIITVRNCSDAVRRVFAATALTEYLGVEPSRRP